MPASKIFKMSSPNLACTVLIPLAIAGCSNVGKGVSAATGVDDYRLGLMSEPQIRAEATALEAKFRRNNTSPTLAVAYSQHLRHLGETASALKLMQMVTIRNPEDPVVLKEYGKTLLESGDFATALKIFERGRSPVNADWDLLNQMGVAQDHIGNTQAAQALYADALKHRPGEPRVLANLGMSHALSGNIVEAERYLTTASAHPNATNKIMENLALVRNIRTKVAGNGNLPTLSDSEIARAAMTYMQVSANGLYPQFDLLN